MSSRAEGTSRRAPAWAVSARAHVCKGGFSACPHVCVPRCTCACPPVGAHACLHVRLCTCGSGLWPESCRGGGGCRGRTKARGGGGGTEQEGFSLPFSSRQRFPALRLGKAGPSKAVIMSPGLSQGCLAQRALPRRLGSGSERRAPQLSAAVAGPEKQPRGRWGRPRGAPATPWHLAAVRRGRREAPAWRLAL